MKNFIITKYPLLKHLLIAVLFCFFLLAFRIKSTGDVFGLFLVWNLFLAFIPLGISWYVEEQADFFKKPIKRYTALATWLLFLPNAPYVITDLIHVFYSPSQWVWYDAVTISTFALLSLYFGFKSVAVWRGLFQTQLQGRRLDLATILVLMLCGFGIYLGRVLRFNSWDLLTHPADLFLTIWQYISNPVEHKGVWIFTFGLGSLLSLGYFGYQNLIKPKRY